MAGFLPASEGELYLHRPGSNQPNIFPREALLGGEKVIFETRPGYLWLHPGLVLGSLPFVVLMLLVTVVGLAEGLQGAAAIFVFLFLSLIPMLYAAYSWRRSAYALTDQRVLARVGDDYDASTYDQIQEISMRPRSSRIVFTLRPPAPGLRVKPGRMVWRSVPAAPGVLAFSQSAAAFYGIRNRQSQLRSDLTVAAMVDKVVCQYCGGLIDVATLSPENPRCPRCSAPFTVAPNGF